MFKITGFNTPAIEWVSRSIDILWRWSFRPRRQPAGERQISSRMCLASILALFDALFDVTWSNFLPEIEDLVCMAFDTVWATWFPS